LEGIGKKQAWFKDKRKTKKIIIKTILRNLINSEYTDFCCSSFGTHTHGKRKQSLTYMENAI